jgi:hypothetical protein
VERRRRRTNQTAKMVLRIPIAPRETPTPIPTFRPVLSVVLLAGMGVEEMVVVLCAAVDDDVVDVEDVEDEVEVVLTGTKFHPFI